MKKIIISLLCFALLPSTLLCSCFGQSKDARFGMGVYSYYSSADDANEDKNGSVKAVYTAAAVLINKNGKVIDIDLDCAECTGAYTKDGKALTAEKLLTKGELGESYGMAKYGTDRNGDGKVLEWEDQVEALEEMITGKTLNEIKALVAGSYGTEDVVNAGCTIAIADFVKAIETAFTNAKAAPGNADETELGIVSVQSSQKDATADANGTCDITTYIAAAIRDDDDKVTAMQIDCAEASVNFDINGKAVTSISDTIKTKNELGADYGMAKYGTDRNGDGKTLEWYEQAESFANACIGKTAAEIAGLIGIEGYAPLDVQNAGCTIYISDMAKAAVKAAE